jgi:hypothetical protein
VRQGRLEDAVLRKTSWQMYLAVVDFVATKASKNIKIQQRSIQLWQTIQKKAVAIIKVPQISIMA